MADVHTKLEAAGTVGTKLTYVASSGLTFFGVFTAQELAALFGIVLAVLTFATTTYINWYWRKKSHDLELEELRLRYPLQHDDEDEGRPG